MVLISLDQSLFSTSCPLFNLFQLEGINPDIHLFSGKRRSIDWADSPKHAVPSAAMQMFLKENVPATYCKAHAVAYTSNALRLAWIKAIRPDLWEDFVG